MTKPLGTWATTVGAIATVIVLLAGCGSVPEGSAAVGQHSDTPPASTQPVGGNAGLTLCSNPAAAQRAVVSHLSGLHSYSEYGTTDFGASQNGVVTGPDQTRALAEALCALPIMPLGRRFCPIAVFDVYQLIFTVSGRTLPVVTVRAAGCRQVTGLGQVRWAEYDNTLLQELARITANVNPGGPMVRPSD
jgi:hypothetical protein